MKKFDISNLVISRICDIYSYTLEEDTHACATLPYCALIIKRKGRSLFTADRKIYTADSNHILFLPAGTSYEMTVDRPGECTVLAFDVLTEEALPIQEYYADNESDMISTVKNILHYWNLHGPAYRSKCLSELFNLITQISTLDSYANSLAGKYRLIHKSVKYIEQNFAEQDLYTPQLAAMSGIGETYYRSIFIAVFGMPPARYIQQYRIGKAKQMLITGNLSVEEIAFAVGFANSSYFCKVFKSLTGLTPSEFAEKGRLIG